MTLFELFLIAVGLSMDAFAVAVCKGLSLKKMSFKPMIVVGLYFGFFQAGMPLIGYFLGKNFQNLIVSFDHWIAFLLLVFIGGKMVYEAIKSEEEDINDSLCCKEMIPVSVATSIDALAVGVTFAFLEIDIVPAVSFIGITTFVLSAIGVKIGNVFGAKFKSKAEIVGGGILVAMGFKILIEHLYF